MANTQGKHSIKKRGNFLLSFAHDQSPLRVKNLPKIGKKREKLRKNREKEGKIGKKRKNWEGSFTLPVLTDRAGYTTAHDCIVFVKETETFYHLAGVNLLPAPAYFKPRFPLPHTGHNDNHTLLKQTIEKSICKDCGGGKILIRLKIQS